MKNDPTQLFRTQSVACTKPKLFVLQLGAPLTNRKVFMRFMYFCHVVKNTLPHPSSLVRIQHLAQRFCSGWRCRECLPEGSAALANMERILCTKSWRSVHMSYCGEDLIKTRRRSLSQLHFTADLHQRGHQTRENLHAGRQPGKCLYPMTRVDRWNAAYSNTTPKDLPTADLWHAPVSLPMLII